MDTAFTSWVYTILDFLAAVFVVLLGLGLVAVVVIYIIDVTQTKQAIRRNYPVIGRFRYLFEHMGEFFSAILFCHGQRGASF